MTMISNKAPSESEGLLREERDSLRTQVESLLAALRVEAKVEATTPSRHDVDTAKRAAARSTKAELEERLAKEIARNGAATREYRDRVVDLHARAKRFEEQLTAFRALDRVVRTVAQARAKGTPEGDASAAFTFTGWGTSENKVAEPTPTEEIVREILDGAEKLAEELTAAESYREVDFEAERAALLRALGVDEYQWARVRHRYL